MLAAVPQDVPLREHSHLDLHNGHQDPLLLDDRLCPGCKKSAVNEQGGLVVAFGQSFFHVDCFKCAKCRNQVTADTNLLLLSDGSPICANCSYSCNICRLPILDEAIMTGDDSYHAHCFKCKVCSNRIDELVFAKTSQGIYCMNCHNERMIKIRKHAQKKAERERANGGSGSSRSRENDAKNYHRDQEARSPPHKQPSSSRLETSRTPDTARPGAKPYVSDAFEALPPSYTPSAQPSDSASPSPYPSRSPSVTVAPPVEPDAQPTNSLPPSKSNTLPTQPASGSSDSNRRSTYDDGVRPLNVLLKQDPRLADSGNLNLGHPDGLSVTSRRDKRRSINPGLSLPSFQDLSPGQTSPRNGSFGLHDRRGTPTPPYLTAIDRPPFSTSTSRPSSQAGSLNSPHSPTLKTDVNQHRSNSRSSSLNASHDDQDHDDTIVMTSPPSMTVELEMPVKDISSSHYSNNARFSGGSASLSPTDANGFDWRRRGSTSSNFSLGQRSGGPSRSASPAYRADVPQNVESETESDNEDQRSGHDVHPPAPPPKDPPHSARNPSFRVSDGSTTDAESSEAHHPNMSEDMGESTAVEQTQTTTFIAPALPPIRFSMNTADFSELLSSVGGLPSLKSLDNLAKLTKQAQEEVPSTPPPTATTQSTAHPQSDPSSPSTSEGDNQPNPVMTLTPSDDSKDSLVAIDHSSAMLSPSTSSAEPTKPTSSRQAGDVVIGKLREAVSSAKEQGAYQLSVDLNFADAIIDLLESRNTEFRKLKHKVDGMNRESKRFIDGLTVAQVEYDQELKARRDAEAEVTRLRVLLSGQAARLTALSGDNRKQELRQQMNKEMNDSLSGLEHDLSRLKVERDMTLAEVEELSAKKTSAALVDAGSTNLGRSFTKRLETIRTQYQKELLPLNEQKEKLTREIAELKGVRDVFLEETTVLNARNEELAQLSAVYARRLENSPAPIPETPSKPVSISDLSSRTSSDAHRPSYGQTGLIVPSLSSSTSGSSTIYDDGSESRHLRTPKSETELHTPAKAGKFKWMGSKTKENIPSPASIEATKSKAHIEHNFQQVSVLRFARCDHCGEKMWGSQLRCTTCTTSIHVRCIANVQIACTHQNHNVLKDEPPAPLPPSMFGRDLTEQVHADARDDDRQVPVIVEKCIQAVEERALDYEGIYRKTGGSGQSKAITQMFERGDYDSFDLCDEDRFNDICSVTSVLKTYFRTLPVPLLTFDLHDQFMTAIAIRDPALKQKSLADLVNMLPNEHYYTLRLLMLHLNRVCTLCDKNLMNGRNLGVVFGPTLLRSRDPGAEFSDMAGKALFVEWLVENAPVVFNSETL